MDAMDAMHSYLNRHLRCCYFYFFWLWTETSDGRKYPGTFSFSEKPPRKLYQITWSKWQWNKCWYMLSVMLHSKLARWIWLLVRLKAHRWMNGSRRREWRTQMHDSHSQLRRGLLIQKGKWKEQKLLDICWQKGWTNRDLSAKGWGKKGAGTTGETGKPKQGRAVRRERNTDPSLGEKTVKTQRSVCKKALWDDKLCESVMRWEEETLSRGTRKKHSNLSYEATKEKRNKVKVKTEMTMRHRGNPDYKPQWLGISKTAVRTQREARKHTRETGNK